MLLEYGPIPNNDKHYYNCEEYIDNLLWFFSSNDTVFKHECCGDDEYIIKATQLSTKLAFSRTSDRSISIWVEQVSGLPLKTILESIITYLGDNWCKQSTGSDLPISAAFIYDDPLDYTSLQLRLASLLIQVNIRNIVIIIVDDRHYSDLKLLSENLSVLSSISINIVCVSPTRTPNITSFREIPKVLSPVYSPLLLVGHPVKISAFEHLLNSASIFEERIRNAGDIFGIDSRYVAVRNVSCVERRSESTDDLIRANSLRILSGEGLRRLFPIEGKDYLSQLAEINGAHILDIYGVCLSAGVHENVKRFEYFYDQSREIRTENLKFTHVEVSNFQSFLSYLGGVVVASGKLKEGKLLFNLLEEITELCANFSGSIERMPFEKQLKSARQAHRLAFAGERVATLNGISIDTKPYYLRAAALIPRSSESLVDTFRAAVRAGGAFVRAGDPDSAREAYLTALYKAYDAFKNKHFGEIPIWNLFETLTFYLTRTRTHYDERIEVLSEFMFSRLGLPCGSPTEYVQFLQDTTSYSYFPRSEGPIARICCPIVDFSSACMVAMALLQKKGIASVIDICRSAQELNNISRLDGINIWVISPDTESGLGAVLSERNELCTYLYYTGMDGEFGFPLVLENSEARITVALVASGSARTAEAFNKLLELDLLPNGGISMWEFVATSLAGTLAKRLGEKTFDGLWHFFSERLAASGVKNDEIAAAKDALKSPEKPETLTPETQNIIASEAVLFLSIDDYCNSFRNSSPDINNAVSLTKVMLELSILRSEAIDAGDSERSIYLAFETSFRGFLSDLESYRMKMATHGLVSPDSDYLDLITRIRQSSSSFVRVLRGKPNLL